MSGLNQEQIEHLGRLMDERWTREFGEIRSLLASGGELQQHTALGQREADTSDEALLNSLSATNQALIQQNLQDVRDVAAARQRLAAGTYGECTDCGVHIPAARLKATPEAARCIHCQKAWEKKHPL